MNAKKLVVAIVLTVFFMLPGPARCESIQLDESFTRVNEWLNKQKLNVTGGPNGARDDLAAFNQKELVFYGEAAGNPEHQTPAQRGIMAKRAAVVMAQTALVEYLEGFALVGDTLVKDAMAKSSNVRTGVAGFVKGSQVVYQEYSKEDDVAVAIIKLGLHGPKGFGSLLYETWMSDANANNVIDSGKPAFSAAPVPLETLYDGLIIDATGQNFKPALINRLYSAKGEVLYDPAKIDKKVLVEQGCGEYANSVDKAKSALASRGVKNPLVIKAIGSVSQADIQVADEDALSIFSANTKTGFLTSAKVAFVLR
jgi:hypothetical protein